MEIQEIFIGTRGIRGTIFENILRKKFKRIYLILTQQ